MGGRATTSGARSLALPLLALFKPSFVLLFFLSSAVSSGLAGSRIADGVLLPAGQDRSRSAPPQIKPGVGHFGEGSHGLNISRTFLANSASTSLHSSSTGPSRSAAARLSSVHSVAPSSTPLSPSSLLRGSKASRSAFPSFSSLRKEKLSTSSAEKQGIVDNSFEDEGLEGRARKPRAPPAVDESLIDLSGHSDTPEMSPSAGVNDVLAPARILNPKQFARQLVAKVHTAFVQRDQRIAEDQKDGKENVEKERRHGSSALLGVDEQLKQADHGDVAADDGETGEIDVNEAEALIPDEESVGRSVFLQDAREFEDDDGEQDDDADDVSSSHDIRARDAHTFAFVQNTDQTEKEEAEGSSQEDDDMVGSNEETGSKSKSEGGDASEKEEKSEKGDTSERGDKSEKEDTTEKEEKSENGDTSERGDKSENGDTSEKEDQSGKGDTSQQGDKSEKEEKSEAADKSEADTSKNSSSAKAGVSEKFKSAAQPRSHLVHITTGYLPKIRAYRATVNPSHSRRRKKKKEGESEDTESKAHEKHREGEALPEPRDSEKESESKAEAAASHNEPGNEGDEAPGDSGDQERQAGGDSVPSHPGDNAVNESRSGDNRGEAGETREAENDAAVGHSEDTGTGETPSAEGHHGEESGAETAVPSDPREEMGRAEARSDNSPEENTAEATGGGASPYREEAETIVQPYTDARQGGNNDASAASPVARHDYTEGSQASPASRPDDNARATGSDSSPVYREHAWSGEASAGEGQQEYTGGAGYAAPVSHHDQTEASPARSVTTPEWSAQATGSEPQPGE
ncbi:rhoptry neck protein RON6, partial [Toxoplasma gondii MAS]